MDNSWLIYTALTVAYIVILVIYFLRRSKNHEKELSNFLEMAQTQLENYKKQAEQDANLKISKAMAVVKKVQQAAEAFETQAQAEYDQIIEDAKGERREIIAQAKSEVEELFKKADKELEEYKATRHREIEKNLVKLVVAVTEKVVETSLSPEDHKDLINKTLEEVMKRQAR